MTFAVDHQCVHPQKIQPLLQCILLLQALRISKGVMTHFHPLVYQKKPLVPLILFTVHEAIWRNPTYFHEWCPCMSRYSFWKKITDLQKLLGVLGSMKNEIFILCTDTYNLSPKIAHLEFSIITIFQWNCCLVNCEKE